MYLTAVGFVMVVAGLEINDDTDIEVPGIDTGVPDYSKLLFAGGFLTTLFWVWKINYYSDYDNGSLQ